MESNIVDPFWFNDPFVLPKRMAEFWVSSDMTNVEKLNSLVRFFIYISVILSLYNSNFRYLLIIPVIMGITYFINEVSLKKENCPENFEQDTNDKITVDDKKKFKTPTLNNPYMNSTIYDYQNPKQKRAIPYQNNSPKSLAVKKEIHNKFSYNTFEDYSDIYSKNFNRFYTMPAEFTANDKREEFRKFLYGDIDTNKTNSYKSINGIYVDYGRPN